MLEVKIDKIVPVTDARDSFNKIIDEVEGTDELYVLTKNGKPVAVMVGVHHLEKLTGTSHEELMEEVDSAPAEEETAKEEPATKADNVTSDTSTTVPDTDVETNTDAVATASGTPEPATDSTVAPDPVPTPEPVSGATAAPFGQNDAPTEEKPFVTPAEPADSSTFSNEDPLDFLDDNSAEPDASTSSTAAAPTLDTSAPSTTPAFAPSTDTTQTTPASPVQPVAPAAQPNPTFPPANNPATPGDNAGTTGTQTPPASF